MGWITKRVTEMLKIEDDVVVEFIFNQLEKKSPDPRKMQINLTGFLNGKYARVFMGELWAMLDSAQNSENGIPTELVNMKIEEMKDRKNEDSRIAERLRKLADHMGAEAERERQRELKEREKDRDRRSPRRDRSRDRRRSRSRDRRRDRSRDRRDRSIERRERRSRSNERREERKRDSPREERKREGSRVGIEGTEA